MLTTISNIGSHFVLRILFIINMTEMNSTLSELSCVVAVQEKERLRGSNPDDGQDHFNEYAKRYSFPVLLSRESIYWFPTNPSPLVNVVNIYWHKWKYPHHVARPTQVLTGILGTCLCFNYNIDKISYTSDMCYLCRSSTSHTVICLLMLIWNFFSNSSSY